MRQFVAAALVSLMTVVTPVLAQVGHAHDAGGAVNSGEVKRVNTTTKKITIAHGPLKAHDMPAMTMAFAVKDPALLDKVKPGDKVNFVLEKSGENLVITRIEPAR